MRPSNLHTRIFLDSGDPAETRQALELLGFLDGQTTNPSLIAKNPQTQARLAAGDKFSRQELDQFYQAVVQEVSQLIPDGSVSIEVYADQDSMPEQLLSQAEAMFGWIDNAHIKFPVITAGVAAAAQGLQQGMRANMTLVFTPEQAAAVHAIASRAGAQKGDVFVSPFVGRLDDKGINGLSLVHHLQEMYREVDSPVEVLAASIRSLDHLLALLAMQVEIVTVPLKVLQQWAEQGLPVPQPDEAAWQVAGLQDLPAPALDLSAGWQSFDLSHPQTSDGLAKFAADWNKLID